MYTASLQFAFVIKLKQFTHEFYLYFFKSPYQNMFCLTDKLTDNYFFNAQSTMTFISGL